MKLSIAEAARLLAVPEAEVHDWMRSRHLPYVRVQERPFIHRARLSEWAREHGVPLHPDVFDASLGGELADALGAGRVARLPTPASASEGARTLVAALGLPATVDTTALARILAARPGLGFTVDADGVARPRLFEPILTPGPATLSLFAFDPPWEHDRLRLARVFVLVAPTMRAHQRLLAELDAALHQAAFADAVRYLAPRERLEEVTRRTPIPVAAVAAK